MEEIVRIYGSFILEGIAVISLTIFICCNVNVGTESNSILKVIGENIASIIIKDI